MIPLAPFASYVAVSFEFGLQIKLSEGLMKDFVVSYGAVQAEVSSSPGAC